MLLEDFTNEGASLDLTAAAQQAALCCMVYEKETALIEQFIGPESRLLAWSPQDGTWLPSVALIQSGPKRFFGVSEGTVSYSQSLIQVSPLNSLMVLDQLHPDTGPLAGIFYWYVAQQLVADAQAFIDFSDPEVEVFLAGHSMGGAVAQVAAWLIKKTFGTPNLDLMTFGQPKAMGHIAPEMLPEFYWRIASVGDPIPDYPFAYAQYFLNLATLRQFGQLAPQAWTHYGSLVTLYNDGDVFRSGPPKYPPPEGITQDWQFGHGLENYLGRILLRAEVNEVD